MPSQEELMDTRIPLAKAALFIGACAVGGFGLGVLIAAAVAKRVMDEVVM